MNPISTSRRGKRCLFSLALFFALVLGLTIARHARADYIGPQRGSHQVCGAPHNVFYVANGLHQYMCSYDIQCGDQPSTPGAVQCSDTLCTDLANGLPYLQVEDSCHDVQDPPATVAAQLQCTAGGGWCRDGATVVITGSEPVAGYTITGIEGTLDGTTFACQGATCNVPVSTSGSHHLTYWALSSYGDTSLMGQMDVQVDADNPTVTLDLPPADGHNGWYVHGPVSLDAQATDATSGLASLAGALDGGGWEGLPITLNAEGLHTATFRAEDVAGHVVTVQRQVGLDLTPPTASVDLPAPDGANGWYVEPVTARAVGSDATSGVAAAEIALDGGAWQAGQAVVPAGEHSVQVRVEDGAGWTSTANATVKVDTDLPTLSINLPPPDGQNGWYQTPPTLDAQATDATSGLASLAGALDGGGWEGLPITLNAEGLHAVAFRAEDVAGHVVTAQRQVGLDLTPPTASVDLPAPDGANGWYLEPVTARAVGSDATSGVAAAEIALDGGAWQAGQAVVPAGVHSVQVRVEDGAGWTSTANVTVKVDTTPPEMALRGGSGGTASCKATLQGTVTDAESGVASAALQLDGGAWQPLTLDASGNWQEDTGVLPDGAHTIAVRAEDEAGRTSERQWQVIIANAGPGLGVHPGGKQWYFWQTLYISARYGCVPASRLEVRVWEPGTSHERVWRWENGWHGENVAVKWDTRWYSASGPYAHAGRYPIAITVWDAWGRTTGVQGTMVVSPQQPTATPTAAPTATPWPTSTPLPGPVVVPSPLPTATPTATPAGSSSGPPQAPVAPGGNGKAGGGSGPVVVNGTEHITTAPPAAPRRPLGNLPFFGAAAAGFLAAWAAYARRKRLQRAWEEARERAARAAREAARRAKAAALIAAVARDLARRRQRQAAASADDPPPEDEPPPRPHPIPLTIDGEVPLSDAASGRVPQPAPPHPDGSYTPHGLRQGYASAKPVDIAAWKQADYAQMGHAQEVARASKPKPWWQRTGDWIAHQLDNIAGAITGGWVAWKIRHLKFTPLEDGHISVRAETPPGTRRAYRQMVAKALESDPEEFFAGTRYTPETVAARTSGGLLRSARSAGNLVLAGVLSLAQNLWQFGANPAEGKTFWDRTVKNREFWVSTAVDTGVSVVVGVAAAALVAGAIASAPGWLPASAAAIIATPAVATAATAIAGIGMSLGVEATGFPERAKSWLNRKLEKLLGR